MTIRAATLDDAPAIRRLAVETEMFSAEETGWIEPMLGAACSGEAPDDRWLVLADEQGVHAAAYYAPEAHAAAMWNVFFISVAPQHHGRGLGSRLMAHIEQELAAKPSDVANVLLVETSSTEKYARTRSFYAHIGYTEEARIREYYGPGDDKVVFWKKLTR